MLTYGCSNDIAGAHCSDTANLAEDEFTAASTTYSIGQLWITTQFLNLEISPALPAHLVSSLTLKVGSASFALSNAATSGETFTWTSPGLSWSAGDSVSVSLERPDNTAPTVANPIPDQAVADSTAFDYAFPPETFADAEGDPLTFSATKGDDTALPSWLAFTSATRTFSGTPPVSARGRHTVKVTASDGRGGSASDEFVITVSVRPNTAPRVNIAIPDRYIVAGDRHTWPIAHYNFTDAEGDALTYAATKGDDTPLPSWLKFTAATGTFVANVGAAQIGDHTVKVTASDGRGGSVSDEFEIKVTARGARTVTGGALKICGRQRWSDATNAVIWQDMILVSRGLGEYSNEYGFFNDSNDLLNGGSIGIFPHPPGAYGHTLSRGYSVTEIVNNAATGAVRVKVGPSLTAEDRAVLSITLCDQNLRFSDATESVLLAGEIGSATYTWSNTGLDWSALNYAASPAMIDGRMVHGKVRASLQVGWINIPPRVTRAQVSGTTLTLKFSQQLNVNSRPEASAFTLSVGDLNPHYAKSAFPPDITAVAVANVASVGTVTLTLNRAPSTFGPHRPGLRVAYTPPATNPLKTVPSGTAVATLVKAFSNVYAADVTSTANAAASDPPQIAGAPGLSASQGTDGAWSPGETVEASLTFDEAVVVDTTNGTPSVELRLGGNSSKARSATYVRGSGTTTLVFFYTLTAEDGSHASMFLTGDSLALNGGTIRGQASGEDALLTHAGLAKPAEPAGTARSSQDSEAEGEAVTVAEDAAYTFKPSDFGFDDDPKRDRNSNVTIKTLPGAGALTVNGGAARKNQTVSKTDIGKGRLVFTPVANAHGNAYASFDFTTYNGSVTSDTATMTVNVRAVNDDPAGAPGIDGEAEAGRTVTATTSGVSDPDGLTKPGWTYRWIRVADGAETAIEGETGSAYTLTAADVGHKLKVEVSFTDDAGTEETVESAAWPSEGSIAAALSAAFSGAPATHDGEREFTVSLRFSAEPAGLSFATVRDSLLVATNATILGARRLTPGSNAGWEIRARPGGTGAVRLTLPVRACGAANAICVDGRALGAAASVEIAYAAPQVTQTPLTAAFTDVPSGHGGGAFTLELALSEDVRRLGYATVGGALAVTGGRLDGVRRLVHGRNRRWEVRVSPNGLGAVRVSLAATQDCASSGAICTPEGKMLSTSASATVPGPALSAADATVEEGVGAELAFTVSLSRAAAQTVTVGYATSDGTATAGADYTSASGTLTFAAGDTSKTVRVAVLDDAHDEASETMTLTLSNPSPASVELADAEATGTITNTDAMPGAWLGRLGRTVGSQVLEAVSERVDGGAAASRFTVGGVSLGGGAAPLDDAARLAPQDWLARQMAEGAEGVDPQQPEGRTLTGRDLLLGSSFHLVSQASEDGGALWSAWGRVSTGGFSAEVDGVTMDGEVVTGLLGFDAEWQRLLAGVLLLRSEGDGGYNQQGGDGGTIESTLSGVYPYARLRLGGGLSVWAVAGAGAGDLRLAHGAAVYDTGLDVRLGALGVRGALPAVGGFDLAVKSDVLWVRTASDAVSGDLAAASADVTRLRLILEGGHPWTLSSGAVLAPTVQIGLRHDGGDAETGTGVEVGAGLRYSAGMLGIDAQVRALLAHEAGGYEEWGASGSIRLSPNASGLGPSLAVLPSWGTPGSGAAQLWSQPDAAALVRGSGPGSPPGRVAAELAWGLAALRGRGVLTPYARLALAEEGRHWHLGTRLALAESLDLSLEGSTHDLTLRATVPW